MKDIPVPTLGFSPTTFLPLSFADFFTKIMPRKALEQTQPTAPRIAEVPYLAPQPARASTPPQLKVHWAQHLDEVREAQRLRYAIFAGEMGAKLSNNLEIGRASCRERVCMLV